MNQASQILAEVKKAVCGKDRVLIWVLTVILAKGHILLEDIPGVGKTTMALAFSRALGLDYGRVQFTPDVLPSDITGYSIFDKESGTMRYQPGVILCNLFLADELNRATSRTQSALLEAMEEGQVTVDGETVPVPRPFLVLATQNPLGLAGTYPLPEAQLDRFLLCVHMGYPAPGEEVRILDLARGGTRPEDLPAVTSAAEILEMQRRCREVKTAEAVKQYVVRIAEETRRDRSVSLGASPRASLMLLTASMAWALLHGRDYVLPDDVQRMARPVLCHRMVMRTKAGLRRQTPENVIAAVLHTIPVPTVP